MTVAIRQPQLPGVAPRVVLDDEVHAYICHRAWYDDHWPSLWELGWQFAKSHSWARLVVLRLERRRLVRRRKWVEDGVWHYLVEPVARGHWKPRAEGGV